MAQVAGAIAGAVVPALLDKVLGSSKGTQVQMPDNPHLMTPTEYTSGQRSAYVAGRGFRKL